MTTNGDQSFVSQNSGLFPNCIDCQKFYSCGSAKYSHYMDRLQASDCVSIIAQSLQRPQINLTLDVKIRPTCVRSPEDLCVLMFDFVNRIYLFQII